jgi:glycosyltransferase involved in cell wall biosynthesis
MKPERYALHIVHEYPPIVGGAGVFARFVADTLSGDLPIVVITANTNNKTEEQDTANQRIIRLGIPFRKEAYHYATAASLAVFLIRAVVSGWREGRRTKPKLIHAFHVFPAGVAAIFLSRILGVDCLVTGIGAELYDPSRKTAMYSRAWYRWLISAVLKRANLSAISTDIAERMKEYYPPAEVAIFPPGIPCPPVLAGRSESRKDNKGPLRLVSVCRLAPRKGLDLVMRSIALLRDLDIRYSLVGDGIEREALENQANELGIRDRVTFHGFVDDAEKWRILAASDVFVLPSLHEGFGIAYLEAMAVGLAVIAMNFGGQTDFIRNSINGILLNGRTAEELADALHCIYRDRVMAERMGEAAKETAKAYFPDAIRTTYLRHYERLPPITVCRRT